MKIHEMELLVRVAETGSMTRAAKQLHLTTAAVSAAIQRIENDIGARLFERTTRALHPTDEGLVVLEGCQDVIARWQRTLEDVKGQGTELEGTVHLSAPADTSYEILESLIVDLCKEHPKLRIILDSSDKILHLHQEAIDLAIRYGPLKDSTLAARRLVNLPGILVASPSYLEEWGVPQRPEDLADHRCLALRISNVPTVAWKLTCKKDGETQEVLLNSPLCGDGFISRRWAVAGLGIAFKNLFDVIDDLEAGRLVRVLPGYSKGLVAIHVVFPSRNFMPARVRAVDQAIAENFTRRAERCQAWLEANT